MYTHISARTHSHLHSLIPLQKFSAVHVRAHVYIYALVYIHEYPIKMDYLMMLICTLMKCLVLAA